MKLYHVIIAAVLVFFLGFISYGCYLNYNENKLVEAQNDSIEKTKAQIFYEPVIIFMQPTITYNDTTGYYHYSIILTDGFKTKVSDYSIDSTKSIDSLLTGIESKIDEKYNEVMQGYHIDEFIPNLPGRLRPFYQK